MSESSSAVESAPSAAIDIGGVFSRTFSVLKANLIPFLVISFLLAVPLLLFNLFLGGAMVGGASGIGAGYFLALLISLVTTYATMGVLVYGTVAQLRGQPAGLSLCISRGLAVIVPVILVALVVTVLISLGLVVLIIPGIFVMTVTAVAVPAVVVEQPGIWASVKRSFELTKGNRWRVLALLVIFYAVVSVDAAKRYDFLRPPAVHLDRCRDRRFRRLWRRALS